MDGAQGIRIGGGFADWEHVENDSKFEWEYPIIEKGGGKLLNPA